MVHPAEHTCQVELTSKNASDLPEEHSTVLLLGVTRIPSSPTPQRRPCSVPSAAAVTGDIVALPQVRRSTFFPSQQRSVVRRNSSKRKEGRPVQQTKPPQPSNPACVLPATKGSSSVVTAATPVFNVVVDVSTPPEPPPRDDGDNAAMLNSEIKPVAKSGGGGQPPVIMETSVDSIGTCSLDVDASVGDLSDWSDVTSVGTLRSKSIPTPQATPTEPHLPSYLSLACTINGYSTTTNYDPVRLARSRDASPHRIEQDNLTPNKSYSIQNNLLSPPNLVPLPTTKKMAENALAQHHHQKFYSSMKTVSYISQESHFATNLITKTKDSVDGCVENGHNTMQSKCVSFENKNITTVNGQSKCTSETILRQEFSTGKESKSFIQQRVERLYGPGALAQAFFVTKRQKDRLSESEETQSTHNDNDKHSKSLTDKLLEEESEPTMKQSTSSPTLPVLRHLRPEFRAQLPILSPRKGTEPLMQKSMTVPKLKEDGIKVNGHSNTKVINKVADEVLEKHNGQGVEFADKENMGERDGHYFLKILDKQSARLLELADNVEKDLTINMEDLSEEVIGKLRSASGKARLLVSQKMQQFRGLCTNNLNQVAGEAYPTTNQDLQGFWDMVMLQVDQVDRLFKEINELKRNNWKEVAQVKAQAKTNGASKPRKTATNRPKAASTGNEEARRQREEQRKKMIEERRRAMKTHQQVKPSIEIFVPESS